MLLITIRQVFCAVLSAMGLADFDTCLTSWISVSPLLLHLLFIIYYDVNLSYSNLICHLQLQNQRLPKLHSCAPQSYVRNTALHLFRTKIKRNPPEIRLIFMSTIYIIKQTGQPLISQDKPNQDTRSFCNTCYNRVICQLLSS